MFGDMNFTLLDWVVSFDVDGVRVDLEVIDGSPSEAKNQAESMISKDESVSEIIFKGITRK